MTGTRVLCKEKECLHDNNGVCEINGPHINPFLGRWVDLMWEYDCIDFKSIILEEEQS